MREILFRGKRKNPFNNNEWVYGFLINFPNSETEICYEYDEDWEDNNCEAVIPETVGEFTGILDKNGNKIFEGDIVEFTDDIPGKGEIVYEDAEWFIVFPSVSGGLLYNPLSHYESKNLEIIGNKFDK